MTRAGRAFACAALSAAAIVAAPAQDRTDPVPRALAGVGVEEKLDARLPLALPFTDEAGRETTLGAYLRAGRPLVLTLNYYRCPMLCTLELNGLVEALRGLEWTPGEEFSVATVSIDPRETATLALEKRRSYLEDLGRPGAEAGWHFLTGPAASIDALTRAVGFAYRYDEGADQYGHAAAIVVVTPDGRVSRYLYGVRFDPRTLSLSLVEASRGAIGSAWDRFIIYCYHYDPARGSYALAALRVMRAAGALTVLVLGTIVGGFWLRERGRSDG
ncbi:MAG TPA: SCO family protein [Candidatus Polarisedimenticolaceae bacterium]|nr:SCO family protein [Candidatus Polarisedimenticolaceae bacterium]